jgi:DeoR family galactitol utilization operon repressor
MNTPLSERERTILDLLTTEMNRSVAELSDILQVSRVTVRNDLNSLAGKGMIVRTRGGAIPAFHPDVIRHQRTRVDQKTRIGQAAAALVEDGDTIMIEAGTTTAVVAQHLLGKHDLQVVTNSTLVLSALRSYPSVRLTIVGGEFRPATESLVGPLALSALDRFHVRLAFVGTDGFSLQGGLTTNFLDGAEIVRKMAERAETTILLADSSKYGRRGFVSVLPVESIHKLITDSELPETAVQELKNAGIAVITV